MHRVLILLLAFNSVNAATTVLFDVFPADSLTVADTAQKTGLRVNLPAPDCTIQVTQCREIALLNQFDGFSLSARLQVHFSGPVDPATLHDGIFLVALDILTADEPGIYRNGDRVPINQIVYDPVTNTAYAKPDNVLDQHRHYALIVTDAIKDAAGARVVADPAYQQCIAATTSYCATLARAVAGISAGPQQVVAASVFTTMSATAWLEHARKIVDVVPPMTALLQPQSTFRIADMASLTLHEQVGVSPPKFFDVALPVDSVLLAGIDRVVTGSYRSPNFLEKDQSIKPAPTGPDLAVPATTNEVGFNVLIPSAPMPKGGYPVVIFGHGFGDSRFGGPTAVAPALARMGFAVIAIDAVGHGYGPLSSVTIVDKAGKSTTINALGRSIDLNGDGVIEGNEGSTLITPVPFALRDCLRQTVVDLMQLTRVIKLGLDTDGDGAPDLDAGHIYYAGDSLGSLYGAMFVAVEPSVRAFALNVGGGTVADIAAWSPAYRDLATEMARVHVPSLLDRRGPIELVEVLPDQPVRIVAQTAALDLLAEFERIEWLDMSGEPVGFAPHLRTSPLPGIAARPSLVQIARGDRTMINPASTALIRAGGLQDSTWLYRHDLARAAAPDLPLDPHPFLVLFVSLGGGAIQLPGFAGISISLDAQNQIGNFFTSDGATISDANSLSALVLGGPVFEHPSVLPKDFGFDITPSRPTRTH